MQRIHLLELFSILLIIFLLFNFTNQSNLTASGYCDPWARKSSRHLAANMLQTREMRGCGGDELRYEGKEDQP